MQDETDPHRDRKGLTPAERELELALARLRPSPARLDRDRLIFDAGRLAERKRSRRWMAAAAALGLCALLAVIVTSNARVCERIVYVDRPVEATAVAEAPPATSGTAEGVSYLDLRAAMAEDVGADLSGVRAETRPADRPSLPMVLLDLLDGSADDEGDGP